MEFERVGGKAVSRRRFLGLTGAAAGAAGLAAAGCGGGSKKLTPTARSNQEPGNTAAAAGSPTAQAGDPKLGQTLQYTGFVVSDGIFDPHKTQSGPFYGQQALVFSRLLSYANMGDDTIVPDLAQALPEQPDDKTITFRLNPNAHWDDRDPLKGRAVTSQDVQFSIQRQAASDASFVRASQWANIDTMETPNDHTITFHLKAPFAGILDAFANVNAFIVAPEMVANGATFTSDNQMGSGPFKWVDWSENQFASVSRNPNWFGGNKRPFLDGITLTQPKDSTQVEGDLRVKKLDVASVGRPQADELRQAIPALQQSTIGHSLFFGMRFFLPTAPFDDGRVRQALSQALDRRDMIQQFFAGSGQMNPWISWPSRKWTLPQTELVTLPGYRAGTAGRAQDISEAVAMLAAYTAAGNKLPDPFNLYVLDQAESVLKMGTIMRDQLKASLGLNITVFPVSNAQMGSGLLDGSYAWAAAPDDGWVDLDDWIFPYFHSTGTKNTFPLRNKDMDTLIESQRTELDPAKRQQIGYDIQRNLLVINAGVNFVSETVVSLAWPYVRQFPLDTADGYQNRFADCYIDQTDPTFRGR